MNRKRIEEILDLMEKYGLEEIEVEEEGVKIHLKKAPTGIQTIMQPAQVLHPNVPVKTDPAKEEAKEAQKNIFEMKAPMVGTFYRAPSPDASPYVEIGDTVNEGDILCIIEAMKLMNEIKSEASGKIVGIMVENGKAIEFGQVLFKIEK